MEIEAKYTSKVYAEKKEAEMNESLKDIQTTVFDTLYPGGQFFSQKQLTLTQNIQGKKRRI